MKDVFNGAAGDEFPSPQSLKASGFKFADVGNHGTLPGVEISNHSPEIASPSSKGPSFKP